MHVFSLSKLCFDKALGVERRFEMLTGLDGEASEGLGVLHAAVVGLQLTSCWDTSVLCTGRWAVGP